MNVEELIAGLLIVTTMYIIAKHMLTLRRKENQVLIMASDKLSSVTEIRKNIYILKANGMGIRAIAKELSLSTMAIKYLLDDQR